MQLSDLPPLVQGAAAVALAGGLTATATQVLSVGLPYLHGTGGRWARGTVGLLGTDDGDEDGGSFKKTDCRRAARGARHE